jgi:hypothetical protein
MRAKPLPSSVNHSQLRLRRINGGLVKFFHNFLRPDSIRVAVPIIVGWLAITGYLLFWVAQWWTIQILFYQWCVDFHIIPFDRLVIYTAGLFVTSFFLFRATAFAFRKLRADNAEQRQPNKSENLTADRL